MGQNLLHETIDLMAERWPSSVVARKSVGEFTGGLLSGKTIANYEWRNDGPPKVKMGRLVAYPVSTFIEWLKEKMTIHESSGEPIKRQ